MSSICSHTLYETEHYLATNGGKIPTTYVAFCKLFLTMGSMRQPIETITSKQVINEGSFEHGHFSTFFIKIPAALFLKTILFLDESFYRA